MILYEFVDQGGRGVITSWSLQVRQQAQLDQKLDVLRSVEDREQAEGSLIYGTGERSIFKVKVKGQVQLRPLLCYGPTRPRIEVTFLAQATEVGGELRPAGALSHAAAALETLRTISPMPRRRLQNDAQGQAEE